jgi:hypothetical protein
MDLDHRGRADLAHRFLNAYLEHTGDYAALAVLSFYLVYRALVRAKVASASRGAGGRIGRERVAQRRRAPSRARRKVRRAARPALIITCGLPEAARRRSRRRCSNESAPFASGATSSASECAASRACSDPRSDVDRRSVRTRENARDLRRLREPRASDRRAGRTVVVDATFLRRGAAAGISRPRAALAVPFASSPFEAPEPMLRERIVERRAADADASDADLAVLDTRSRRGAADRRRARCAIDGACRARVSTTRVRDVEREVDPVAMEPVSGVPARRGFWKR